MSLNLTTTFETPKDLAVALLNDSEPDLLFVSEAIEWMDHFAYDATFTTRMMAYFVEKSLNEFDLNCPEYSVDDKRTVLENIIRLAAKAKMELNKISIKETI